ncbi:MAG: tRNA (cytosine(32)/uridine(32)-2'-O)-methyltransferase TrmJ [Chromatiales bacterium]|nr:tRNA (cytosine(32)/uridine(32)-2'-O)-methyltransferase TrmJ [Chromatiales bacterium]
MLENIRIVLVGTTHPGNIGSSARAMKVMGLKQLWLVAPKLFPNASATAMASGADDLLSEARVVDTLEEAVADCRLVVGTSARLRALAWPLQTPREAAEQIVQSPPGGPVAIVFGREASGLSNEEMQQCHRMIHVPTAEDYGSLNLAMAVQILCYELRTAVLGGKGIAQAPGFPPARAEDLERFFTHLQEVLEKTGFLDPGNPRHLMARLRRIYLRAELDENEVNILRGILSSYEYGRGGAKK